MPDWDADSPELRRNLTRTYAAIEGDARNRAPFSSLQHVKGWHASMMDGLTNVDNFPYGKFRGEPGLEEVPVWIGPYAGTAPEEVAAAVQDFDLKLQEYIKELDEVWAPGVEPTDAMVARLLAVSAIVHAEWVRIHPFPNGNGRTARLLVNYLWLRYAGFSLLRVRPRPGYPYGEIARASMEGDWLPTAEYFAEVFAEIVNPEF